MHRYKDSELEVDANGLKTRRARSKHWDNCMIDHRVEEFWAVI